MDKKSIKFLTFMALLLVAPAATAALPDSYATCRDLVVQKIKTDNINDYMTDLKCTVDVHPTMDEQNLDYIACRNKGGKDTVYMDCRLEFYNPDYLLPKNFEECDQSKEGMVRYKECTINLPPDAGEALVHQCVAAGGTVSEPGCVLTFSDMDKK